MLRLLNAFRGKKEDWSVESGGPEQTLSRQSVNTFGQPAGKHTMKEFHNSVRNPESRGIFNESKAPFNQITIAERNLSLRQQRDGIRGEILNDCGASTFVKNTLKPKNVLDLDGTRYMTMGGRCDAAGMGQVHDGETNEFDACGERKVYNMYGQEVSKLAEQPNCMIAGAEGAHIRTIVGRQRDDAGNPHMVIPNRQAAPTLVELREGEVIGDSMTQFHFLEGLKDERLCARYGYMCGY